MNLGAQKSLFLVHNAIFIFFINHMLFLCVLSSFMSICHIKSDVVLNNPLKFWLFFLCFDNSFMYFGDIV